MRWQTSLFIFFLLIQSAFAQSAQEGSYVKPPVIEEGCLLPSPELLDAKAGGKIRISIQVSASGKPTSVKVDLTTGIATQDAAFQQAAMLCSFKPAMLITTSTGQKEPIDGVHKLQYIWRPNSIFRGVARCFTPNYPVMSRRIGEEAQVKVYVYRNPLDETLQFRAEGIPNIPRLVDYSLDVTQRCFANPEVQQDISTGKWFMVPFEWKLDDK